MRHPWRFLLLRKYPRSLLQTPSFSQVNHTSLRSTASFLHTFSSPSHSEFINPQSRKIPISVKVFVGPENYIFRSFSSEPAVEQPDPDSILLTITDILKRCEDLNDIKKEMELNGFVITHDLTLKVLRNLESSPDAARRFFDWVLETDGKRLSSKSYNLMLGILGVNGFIEEFWSLVDAMKKKGYGVSGPVRDKVEQKLEKEGLRSDLEKLRAVFASGSMDNSIEKVSSRVYKVVRNEVWGDDVERKLRELNVAFSTDVVKLVLEHLDIEPMKALIFFRWVEESGLAKHDEQTYNAVARVLGREDCLDRFWKVVDEMRSKGYEMETETFVKVLGRFCKRKIVKEAVDLYEFAMAGANQPSVHCCTFLLRKIAVGKQLDMTLFARVVRIYKESGNILSDAMLDAVIKSLTSVDRVDECNKVLKAMEEGGLLPGGNLQKKIARKLCSAGKEDEVDEFINHMEGSKGNLDYMAWASLVEGQCNAGNLEKASDCFQKMVEKEGVASAGFAFELLVDSYCNKNRAVDASKLLHKYVNDNQLKPWHTTYKLLIRRLLVQGGFKDALNLLSLMKTDGFPPLVAPFIKYLSKSGSSDDAINFLKAMTSKRFPSTSVVLRVFRAFFMAARHDEAQNLLSKCPRYIRNHADVLNLFYTMKSSESATAPVAPVVAEALLDYIS